MNTRNIPGFVAAIAAALSLAINHTHADPVAVEVVSGLQHPGGVAITNQGNLIVSESGPYGSNIGRISIVSPDGVRRTLLGGLPSGIADVGDPSGPSGVFMRGRTLFVAIGVGDTAVAGPMPGIALPNPNPVSSPILSSVLAIHFSAAVENSTGGFQLAPADHHALAAGSKVTLLDAAGERLTVELIADFVNSTSNPHPLAATAIRASNPFDIVVVDDVAYVTDGGQNMVRAVDLESRVQSVLATIPPIPNPLFGIVGGPFMEGVPTGIREVEGMLLVSLFRGAPFVTGQSSVIAIDPATGDYAPFISGLTTAIDVLATPAGSAHDYLVLQYSSAGPFFSGIGNLLGVDSAGGSKTVLVSGLPFSTSMALDPKTNTLYVTNLGGQLLAIPMAP